jgi:hypothetical protein
MPKRFQGDDTHRLVIPAREAYRLWFSFLSMALDDPELRPLFNEQFYAPWGDVKAVKKFDDWWKDHWRLFAFESGTKVIDGESDWKAVSLDQSKIVVAIPRDQTLAETKRQIEAILKKDRAHKAPRVKARKSAVKYAISAANLKYPSLRLLERIYGLWLKHNRNTERASEAYFKWAKARNEQIEAHNNKIRDVRAEKRKLKREAESEQSIGLKPSVETLRLERAVYKLQVQETGWGSKDDEKYEQRRQVIWRYIRKARRIAKNAAVGSFPGPFTE